jgi:periplasmic protein TonB
MAATLQFPAPTSAKAVSPGPTRELHFELLDSAKAGGSYRFTVTASVITHVVLISLIAVVPLLMMDELAPPSTAVRAFFVEPATIAPPPPPPPPPAPGLRATKAAVPTPPPSEDVFRAPVVVPAEIVPESVDLGSELGVEGGVPGGVEGGVAGGVVGGIVGGTLGGEIAPAAAPVRVGGNIKAPKMLRRVAPVYPVLAKSAHVTGIVIVEAQVDERGSVREVRVLRGSPLLDEAALEAVRQWRYQPLLLNGQASAFVLVITVNFRLSGGAGEEAS